MHPVLNRRDLTAQRDAAQRGAGRVDYDDRQAMRELCAELARTNHLLEHALRQEQAEISQLCVTDREPAEATMHNFPVPGARRLIVRRTGNGGLNALVANVPELVLPANENRIGALIVNAGAGAVNLFIGNDLLEPGSSTPLSVGAGQTFLAANGGSWDLRISGLLWSGSVTAVAAAATSLAIMEV